MTTLTPFPASRSPYLATRRLLMERLHGDNEDIGVSVTPFPKRTMTGTFHVPGKDGITHLRNAVQDLDLDELQAAHLLAIGILTKLPQGRRGWWRAVRLATAVGWDTCDYASWLVACSVPAGDVLMCWYRYKPFLFVKSDPECHEPHEHQVMRQDDGTLICKGGKTAP